MTKSQIEACQKRNTQLKQDAIDGKVTIANVIKTCADVDALLLELETTTERLRLERDEQQELRMRIGQESTLKSNYQRTAMALHDRLEKAKAILETFDQTTFSQQEKDDMKDVTAQTGK